MIQNQVQEKGNGLERGHGRRLPSRTTRWRNASAFTLIELLVVVSIIALLISILLPSLKRARDQAKSVACTSNIGGILRGMNIYASEWNGWIPGSPGTSGSVLFDQGYPTDDYAEDIPGSVSQIWDWAGPIAATDMPANRGDRFNLIAEELFVCPANPFTSEPYPNGPKGTFVNQKLMSYNTMRQFMLWAPYLPDGFSVPWGEKAPIPEAQYENQIGGTSTHLTAKNYKPNLDRVENPAEKVFIADGSRYTVDDDPGAVYLDHDVAWDASAGGAFSDGGPTLADAYLRSYKLDDRIAAYSYRHTVSGGQQGLVVGNFDGHAQTISRWQSRFPDPWWPKGSLFAWSEFNDETKDAIKAVTGTDGNDVEPPYDSLMDYQVKR